MTAQRDSRPIVTEAQRRAVLALLAHPLFVDAYDHEIGDKVGVTPAAVRAIRAEQRQNLELATILQRIDGFARAIDWPGTHAELLAWCVDVTIRRSARRGFKHPNARMQALREALNDREREEVLDGMPQSNRAA
jgi:hypothetical protein